MKGPHMSKLNEAYTQRYRESTDAPSVPWNDTLALLTSHRSVRFYSDKPLPDGVLETLITAASSASTSSNKQFWSVMTVDNPDTRAQLARICRNQKHVEKSPLLLLWLADLSRIAALAEARGETLEGLDYTESFLVASMDATLAAQNAAVAAESMGLSVVYLGSMRNEPVQVAKLLKLPQRCFAVFGMCVGYADESVPTAIKPRLPQQAVLHREHYDGSNVHEVVDRYEAHAREFRREQGQSDEVWTENIMGRVRNGKALHGRDRLREELATLGFALK
jgi:nitroreductase